jgi:hypothetical protein
MSQWLEAANRATGAGAELSELHPKPVLSVLSVLSEGGRASPAPARADGLYPDAGAYLDPLRRHGPAGLRLRAALGWGATRALDTIVQTMALAKEAGVDSLEALKLVDWNQD